MILDSLIFSRDVYAFLLPFSGVIFLYVRLKALQKEQGQLKWLNLKLSRENDALRLGSRFRNSDFQNLSEKYTLLIGNYGRISDENKQLLAELENLKQEAAKPAPFAFFKKKNEGKDVQGDKKNKMTDVDITDDALISSVSDYDGFEIKSIFNRTEDLVFRIVQNILQQHKDIFVGWHVHGQTSLGELVRTQERYRDKTSLSSRAFLAINSKRADMVVVNEAGVAALFIEVQGEGHLGKTSEDKRQAENRDRIKKIVLVEKLKVPLLEIFPTDIDANRIESLIMEKLSKAS